MEIESEFDEFYNKHGDSTTNKHEGNSELMTGFLLLNAMIGSGILNQPQVFLNSGIVAAILMFSVAACFIWLGLVALIECGESRGKFDFSSLAKYAYGTKGEKLVDTAIVIGNFGALLSYIDVIGGTLSDLLLSWGCNSSGGCGAYLMSSIVVAFFVLPVCLKRHFGHLAIYSVISMFAIGSVLILVVIAGPIVGNGGDIVTFSVGSGSQLGSIIFTLSCAFAAFPTYTSLKDRTPQKWRALTANTVIVGFFMCCAMGIAGYLSFGPDTNGLILNNFTGHYADFFKLLLVIHLILYIPVEFVVMRHSLLKLFGISKGSLDSYIGHFILTFSILTVATIVILALRGTGLTQGNAFGVVLDFTGGIAGSITSFILPAMFYLKLMPSTEKFFFPCVFMLVFGFIIMIDVPVLSVLSILGYNTR